MARAGRWITRLALLACCAAFPVQGSAQQTSDKELRDSQRRLEQIRRERERLRSEMNTIRSRVHDLSSELRNLERQVATSSSLLEELEFQVVQRQAQVEETQQAILTTHHRLVERKDVLHRRLRNIYKRGPLHTVQVLLTAESFGELINRYKYLYLIARYDRQLVEDVARLEGELAARQRLLQSSLLELQEAQEERAMAHSQLSALRTQQQRALTSAQTRQRTTAQRITQLERDEKRLSGLIATLERKRREAERLAAERRRAAAARGAPAPRSTAPAATLTTRDLGSLGWPVEGRLLYRFGRQTQRNGTVLRWNGIGIGAEAGSPVRTVEAGTVVLAGPFEGYGPTVVVSHGGGYYSLYLYLKDISVREGATVAKNQVVGTVGGERTPEGAHIEFQIRAPGGAAVDPLGWLRQRGS